MAIKCKILSSNPGEWYICSATLMICICHLCSVKYLLVLGPWICGLTFWISQLETLETSFQIHVIPSGWLLWDKSKFKLWLNETNEKRVTKRAISVDKYIYCIPQSSYLFIWMIWLSEYCKKIVWSIWDLCPLHSCCLKVFGGNAPK